MECKKCNGSGVISNHRGLVCCPDCKGLGKTADVPMVTLAETANFMNGDYKQRFIAEYYQLKIRYEKLADMVIKYEAGTLKFTPKCSLDLLKTQMSAMSDYLYVLAVRAQIEDIEVK